MADEDKKFSDGEDTVDALKKQKAEEPSTAPPEDKEDEKDPSEQPS